jgi:DNA-binding transcriptional LysR family regulator
MYFSEWMRMVIMEIRQLKYFLAIAEEGLITKAAERLHITQPPLSQQMILLEKELGVTLFRRTKKRIHLTEAGKALQLRAGQILELLDRTTEEVNETAGGLRGTLNVGIINSSGRLLLPEVVKAFHDVYPLVTFDLHQADNAHILEKLNSHLIDIGFVRLPVDSTIYDTVVVPAERLVAVCPAQLLNHEAQQLPLRALAPYALLVHRRYRSAILDYFSALSFSPHILCTSDEILPLLSWSLRGLGIAIVPEFSIQLLANPGLAVRPLTEPVTMDSSALIWRKNEPLPPLAEHFIQLFKKCVH